MSEKDSILNSGILEQYVLGLLGPVEMREVEQHLANYPELQQHVRSLQATMEQVLQDNAIAPPPALKSSILSEIDGGKVPNTLMANPKPVVSRPFSALTGIVGALALLFAVGTYYFYQKNKASVDRCVHLEQKYQDLQADCAGQVAKQQQIQQQYQFVKDPSTQHIHLRGTALAPKALVVAYLNQEEKNVALDIVNLPEAPTGHCYHLWADVEGKMIHMGDLKAIATDLQSMKFIANAESLNITLEKEGKVEHPTVSQLMVNGAV